MELFDRPTDAGERIDGSVLRVVHHNPTSRYTVLRVQVAGLRDLLDREPLVDGRRSCGNEEVELRYAPPGDGDPAILMGDFYWAVLDPGPHWKARYFAEKNDLRLSRFYDSVLDWAAEHF